MIVKRAGSKPDTLLITFQFPAALWAESVHLVGNFNAWNLHSYPLVRTGDDPSWQITLELERGRSWQFRYWVNGTTWCTDSSADRYVRSAYGGDYSIVET